MGQMLLPAIIVGGGLGVTAGFVLLYVLSDEFRWQRFLEGMTGWMDNRLTRWAFGRTVGRWVNLMTIESYARSGRFERVEALSVREGLIDEAVEILVRLGCRREAGVLARKMGREERAAALFRAVIEAAQEAGNRVLAAEAAEQAGFWTEAVEILAASDSRESRLHAARIAAEHGMPEKAVEVYLENEAVMEALRVAEAAGEVEALFQFCEMSESTVLHHFAADASKRIGDPERGLRILIAHGHLHQAAQFAREAGLPEQALEIREKIAEGKRGQPPEPPPQAVHLSYRRVQESPGQAPRDPHRTGARKDEEPPEKKGVNVPIM